MKFKTQNILQSCDLSAHKELIAIFEPKEGIKIRVPKKKKKLAIILTQI